jgi:hypothetical protein
MTRFLLAAALAPTAAFAQTCPTEDIDLVDAVGDAVSVGSTCAAGNDGAGSCGGVGAEELLFRWTAPADGQYIVDLEGSTYDTLLYAADDACAELSCNDDFIGLASLLLVEATAGNDYYFAVDGYSGCGDYTLNVNVCEDDDNDGACGPFDLCIGDDATGDADGDGTCGDLDFSLGLSRDDATSETTLLVTGAPPNTRVMFVASVDGGQWCHGFNDPWGPLCFQMERPHRIGNVTSDANGDIAWTFVNPQYGVERLKFQAFWATPTDSDVTNVVVQGRPTVP